jgi:hypothetical protein
VIQMAATLTSQAVCGEVASGSRAEVSPVAGLSSPPLSHSKHCNITHQQ